MYTFDPLMTLALLLGGLPVLYLVAVLLFRAGCALADVTDPPLGKTLLVVGVALVVCLPVSGVLVYVLGSRDTDPTASFGPWRGLGVTASLLATWVLSALLYTLFLSAPVRKGFVIAAVELLLGLLLSALLFAVVLVVLAVVQIVKRPPEQPKPASGATPARTAPAPQP